MVIGATNPSAERRERAAIRAVLEKIRPPIDVDAMFAGEGLVAVFNVCSGVAIIALLDASRGELRVRSKLVDR